MAEIIEIAKYFRTCENCKWHDDENGVCKAPGGWEWNKTYTQCLTFRRRPEERSSDYER